MKTKLLLYFTCIFCMSFYGQHVGFETHIISDTVEGAYSVISADIDGDADLDLISASSEDGELNWFENDGQGNFNEHFIGSALNACQVSSGDIDGDGDLDFVAASWGDDKIAWWENTDGQGAFIEHIMTTSADVARSVFCADIDGDGDLDVVACYLGDDFVVWWENDGSGNFVEHIIATNQIGPRIVEAADIDDDGDMDVVTILMDEGKVVWYENLDGLGDFGLQQIILDDPGTAWSITTGDINGDGYVDVITNTDSYTVWCENDAQGNFTIHDVFPEDFSEWFYVEDIDGDGDMDVVSAEIIQQEVGWFENLDGEGGEFTWNIIQGSAAGVRAVYASDINNDGLMDIISGWWGPGVLAWHENIGLGIDDNSLLDFSVYPSPTTGILNINSETPISQIEVYNLLGQLVKSNTDQNNIDISSVDQGVYFVKVMDENGNVGTQKVVKK